jgi:hypothetical protein
MYPSGIATALPFIIPRGLTPDLLQGYTEAWPLRYGETYLTRASTFTSTNR